MDIKKDTKSVQDNQNKINISWYPGHMAKAFREMEEKLRFVDLVIVLLDARVPSSSFNPEVFKKFKNKQILYILTKEDLADSNKTNKWIEYYSLTGVAISVNSKNQNTKNIIMNTINKMFFEKRKKDLLKGLKPRSIKAMVVGIPNVGKSTLINNLVGKKIANVGNKPGITKALQWIKINQDIELLDTPGVLWPKFENIETGLNLALTGAIKDDVLNLDDICNYGVKLIERLYPNRLTQRYDTIYQDDLFLQSVAINKKLYHNNVIDENKVYTMFLNDLRNGYLGRITLDDIQ